VTGVDVIDALLACAILAFIVALAVVPLFTYPEGKE